LHRPPHKIQASPACILRGEWQIVIVESSVENSTLAHTVRGAELLGGGLAEDYGEGCLVALLQPLTEISGFGWLCCQNRLRVTGGLVGRPRWPSGWLGPRWSAPMAIWLVEAWKFRG
jgi:hypothetical protein